jgi:hypothetical protein
VSRTRALIEAYSRTPDQEREAPEQGGASEADREDREEALVRALDFLDACLLPLDADFPRRLDSLDGAGAAIASAEIEAPHSTWHLPRGLLYWLSVAGAASVTWRLSGSVLHSAVAVLTASASVILLELALRTIDPRAARRLGLARGRSDALIYGAAGVGLGIAGGIAIAYFV